MNTAAGLGSNMEDEDSGGGSDGNEGTGFLENRFDHDDYEENDKQEQDDNASKGFSSKLAYRVTKSKFKQTERKEI